MKFATKLIAKESFEWGIFTVPVGEVFYVANYAHKYWVDLYHPQAQDFLRIHAIGINVDKAVLEKFEIVETKIVDK